MRIVTFGSCLARIVAVYLTRSFGGEIISSVYGNRCDSFLGRFVDHTWTDEPIAPSQFEYQPNSSREEKARTILLRDQYLPWIGQHQLPNSQNIFDALKMTPDLIIVDNDVELRSVSRQPTGNHPAFPVHPRPPGETVPPAYFVESTRRLFAYFRHQVPDATLVFINFPHSISPHLTERVESTKLFEAEFSADHTLVIPCVDVTRGGQDVENRHFKRDDYYGYIERIADHMRSQGKGHLVVPKPRREIKPRPVLTEAEKETDRIKREIGGHSRKKDHAAVVWSATGHEDRLAPATLYNVGVSHACLGNKAAAFRMFVKAAEASPPPLPALERAISMAKDEGTPEINSVLFQKHREFFPHRSSYLARFEK